MLLVSLPQPCPFKRARRSGESLGQLTVDHISDRERDLTGIRVLLVEDEDDARDMMVLVLEFYGAVVRAAASAEEALDALREFEPMVLVSDISMPGNDGYWLAGQVKRTRPALPCIAVTAFSRPEDVIRAHSAGFELHLAKPVDFDRLANRIVTLRASAARV